MNLYKFLLISTSLYLLSMNVAAAITPGTIPTFGDLGLEKSPVESTSGLIGVLRGIVQTTYIIFFIIATLFILFAAYNYLTAGGQPEKINTAHKQLLYAGIAIVVALLAVGTSAIIKNFLENPAAGGGVGGAAAAPVLREGIDYPSNAFEGAQRSLEVQPPSQGILPK